MNIKAYKDHYLINDVKYDRVTAVLDFFAIPSLVEYYRKTPKATISNKSKTAKSLGTKVHNAVYAINNGKTYNIPYLDQSLTNCITAYNKWKSIEKPHILSSEVTIWCDKLMVAGTYDMLTTKALIDTKTADKIRLSHWIQLAVYAYLGNITDRKLAVLRLDKLLADYEYKEISYEPYLFECFLGLLNYYRLYKANEKKKEDEHGRFEITRTKVESRLGVFEPEVRNDRSGWNWEE